nr:MAG: replication initiator protein [Microvirus sp.]
MPCYSPLHGWRARRPGASGKYQVVFNPRLGMADLPMTVPCGQCIGCRLERSRQWAIRCVHEAQLHEDNSFITLTYDDVHIPKVQDTDSPFPRYTLVLRDFQLFCKKLRKKIGNFRFFHAGEYGTTTLRPHYHMCVFGYRPDDLSLYKTTEIGHNLYTSKIIDDTWGLGKCWIGEVSFDSAAYVARYIIKKVTGVLADGYYNGRKPEYTTMSRNPGIGAKWLETFKDDVYRFDELVLRGKRMRAPKAYDRRVELSDPALIDKIKRCRRVNSLVRPQEKLDAARLIKESQIQSLSRL